MIKTLISFILTISAALIPIEATAAERITFSFAPFGQFDIQIDDLEKFITKGEISAELAYYLNRLSPKQVARLPQLLSTPLEFNALTISKFSNSAIGTDVIKNFGKGIRSDINQNGFLALRGAIIAAAFDSQGLTVMNVLQKFPLETIYLDLSVLNQYIRQGEKLLAEREIINRTLFTDKSNHNLKKKEPHDLSKAGKYTWEQRTLSYTNPRRSQPGYFDLYLPKKEQAPLIVISHGLASSRQTFSYLGKHLASHGFAVVIVEHNEISLKKFDGFLSGTERFPEPNNLIDQPLDIKFILDKLEQNSDTNPWLKNKINIQQVGIIGHSFGGYTSLILAGGKLIADPQNIKCQTDNYQNVFLDLSSLAKCTFDEFSSVNYQLKDSRVKAVIAINPMAKIFGQTGMKSIDIPTMLISGTNDLIMPPVPEQIEPFSWLNDDLDKYLVLVKPGTHFSFLREGLGVLPVPDTAVGISPTLAYPVIKALTTTFFQAYLTQQPTEQEHLKSDRFLSGGHNFQLSIIRTLTNTQLQELLEDTP
jgi:predicted dienelactone hydrolase/uncharacterized membrane protein YccF (DUF307 family)